MKNFLLIFVIFFSFSLLAEDVPVWGALTDGYYRWEWSYSGQKFVQVSLASIAYHTFWYELNGVEIQRNNGDCTRAVGGGTLTWRMNADNNYCVHLNVRICPDTDYCQKTQCGGGCSVHVGGGGECSTVTCSNCQSVYCSTHQIHSCFSVVCMAGFTHNWKSTLTKGMESTMQADRTACYPTVIVCPTCGQNKCSICGHTCQQHNNECTLKNCTVCGVQWCNIHGIVPIYTTCNTCGRMTCNHQNHTCNSNDPNNPNNNPNLTNSQTANNTTNISNNSNTIVNNTNQIVNNTNTIVNNTNQIVNNTTTIANNTTQISNNTTTIANNTTNIANNVSNIANDTSNISNNTSNIANNVSNISNDTSNISNNTQNMANSLETVAAGVTNSAAAAQAAADATAAMSDKIPDKVETVPEAADPMEELPDRSDAFSTLGDKLLPSFSFFNVSGSDMPSWSFVLPLSGISRSMSDLTFTIGGDAWSTVAEGKLLWLMSITRALSYLVFAYMFLMSVVRSLRQW